MATLSLLWDNKDHDEKINIVGVLCTLVDPIQRQPFEFEHLNTCKSPGLVHLRVRPISYIIVGLNTRMK